MRIIFIKLYADAFGANDGLGKNLKKMFFSNMSIKMDFCI